MKFCSLIAVLMPVAAFAQTFSSGSTGSDGALNFSTPGTYVFDPKTFTPPLDPANDGIFNFTNITVASGVTVKLLGSVLNTPVVWLAQGPVKIDGTIDASGQDGFTASNTTQRTPTIPGAGGYSGGYPAIGTNPAGAGLGPGGGAFVPGGCGNGGGFTANQFLVPLIGGSGGSGYGPYAGGAGGGALLIASSVSISGGGSIKANGGATISANGAGAGGAIRLVAPSVTLSGNLNVSAGSINYGCNTNGSASGVVRIEAFQIGAINASGNYYTATPFGLFLSPSGIPAVRVVSVGGNPVNTSPTGTFTVPDVTVNSNAPLPVAIQATNVPLGTVVTLVIFSENGPDQTNIQSTPLAGTLASSTATASVTLPSGFSKGFVKATFIQ
ncbi:MAG: hypothetical protein ACR2NN_11050 [Bryobacteraceae bacterium]